MTIFAPAPSLAESLTQQTFSRRDLIPLKTDVLWRIERGVVRTNTWSEAGALTSLGYWGSGDVVGHLLSQLNPYQIECITSVKVSIIPAHLWHQVLNAIILHAQQTEELLNIVHIAPVQLRLKLFLLWLTQKFGREVEQGNLIDFPLTHQEIAEVIGTTRVTVTRLMNQFEQEGTIKRQKHHITVSYG